MRMTTATAPKIDPVVQAQYEAYPYPPRNPEDEKKRLVVGTPSALTELEHFVFGGRLPKKLKMLSAGGGTGDAVIMMAQQCKTLGIEAEVTHLDLSSATQAIAKARAEVRGLNIRFIQDSLLNAEKYGPFDYIDCCGVLHHLKDPSAGLRALKAALTPNGSMGLMVYAPLGRTGVYPLQSALRRLTNDSMSPQKKVEIARHLINGLPESNWLKHNNLVTDHRGSDSGVYDLLLHSTDRSYSVPELLEFVASADLKIVAFSEKIKYDPTYFINDPKVLAHLPEDYFERAALAEEISGLLYKHVFYVTFPERAAEAEAKNGPDMVPYYKEFDGVTIGRNIKPNQPVKGMLPGLQVNLIMPRLAGLIMQSIDGVRTWREVYAALQERLGGDTPSWEKFWEQAEETWNKLHSINVALVRHPPEKA